VNPLLSIADWPDGLRGGAVLMAARLAMQLFV
jgi:hypothetical protein